MGGPDASRLASSLSLSIQTDLGASNQYDETSSDECVRVAVRIRPLLASEQGSDTCIHVLPHSSLRIGGSSGPRFTFDQVFAEQSTQAQVFDAVVPLVDSCLQGYHATVLAYGQTGSGKTHTIMGPHASSSQTDDSDDENTGVIPRALHHMFGQLGETNGDAQVHVQFLELYGESIRDLLAASGALASPSTLTIRDLGGTDGTGDPLVVGATWQCVDNAQDALRCMQRGLLRRVTGATAMNETSSRSHALLTVRIEQTHADGATILRSKFHFVDLAGSERQKRTQAAGQRLKEGIDINKGLLVLGNVISALGDPTKKQNFVPYRDSKLTRLLRTSLGGNCKTLVLACVSPSADNLDESLSCLRYANRAKNITNQAILNVDANSQKVQQLTQVLQKVANDWLRISRGESAELSSDVVESLSQAAVSTPTALSFLTASPPLLASPTPRNILANNGQVGASSVEQNGEINAEVNRLRHELRVSQRNHDHAEEQLYATKAEKELVSLQLSILQDGRTSRGSKSFDSSAFNQAFMVKANDYEAQIGQLQVKLREAQAKAESRLADWQESDQDETLRAARLSLERDRQRLSALQSSFEIKDDDDDDDVSGQALDRLENEEAQEQASLAALTKKYMLPDDEEDNVDDGNRFKGLIEFSKSPESTVLRRVLQADLVELSRSIAAKEDLIDQLKLSQEKYASMRDFYEDKLRLMELTLGEKEMEREQLLQELDRTKQEDKPSLALEEQLREKDIHIENLRKKQRELRDLTVVSSRNDTEINRLQSDVQEMKRKKVDLQKQISEERKAHASEVKRLQKTGLQKEKELNKYKMISSKQEAKAIQASQLARNRLEELGLLRAKYKDAETTIRMLSLKRGVLAKAGLDPVIVGRRGSPDYKVVPSVRNEANSVDPDSLRDYFDQKVAEVVRKEALANKVAEEWEEHFELTTKRKDLIETLDKEEQEEALQSITVQLQYKEERIRQLAQRLGKRDVDFKGKPDETDKSNAFLCDNAFAKLCGGVPATEVSSATIRVLFGMIVRERRRVASVARTASSLDERLQTAERAVEENEAALRAAKEEQRSDVAALNQNQQNRILSLMEMVSDASDSEAGDRRNSSNIGSDKFLILAKERIEMLEHELASIQVDKTELITHKDTIENLRITLETNTRDNIQLQSKMSDCRTALRQVRELTTQLGPIEGGGANEIAQSISTVVKSVLQPSRGTPSPQGRLHKSCNSRTKFYSNLSPRVKRHVELMHTSDSGEDGVDTGLSADIMADLALIAEGKLPPSLKGVPDLSQQDRGVVASGLSCQEPESHDRGTVNAPACSNRNPTEPDLSPSFAPRTRNVGSPITPARVVAGGTPSRRQKQRRAMSREIADKLEKLTIPDPTPASTNSTPDVFNEMSSDMRGYKSVFERLVSPSQYTGTQKEKFHENLSRKDRSAREVADRMLDDLLKSDSEGGDSPNDIGKAVVRSQVAEYTQQDVFERLQRTTTQSFAVKHNGIQSGDHPSQESRASLGASNTRDIDAVPGDPLCTSELASQYTQQNVFKRLQTTTTEAYAKKTNKTRRSAESKIF